MPSTVHESSADEDISPKTRRFGLCLLALYNERSHHVHTKDPFTGSHFKMNHQETLANQSETKFSTNSWSFTKKIEW